MNKDFNPALQPHPDTHDIMIRTGVGAINQSLRNLVLTRKYERPYQPLIDGQVYRLLFEDVSDSIASAIQTSILYLINTFEKRAQSPQVAVIVNSTLDGYDVIVQYIPQGQQKPTTLQLGLMQQ